MAIKGKGKTRSRRVVAAPPRPPVYVRKTPLWRRRSTLTVLGVLVVAGVTFATMQTLQNRSEKALRRRETQAVRTFSNRLVASFPTDRQVVPPDVYFFYQSFSQDIEKLTKGNLPAAEAKKKGAAVRKSASAAATRVQAISVDRLIAADLTVSRAADVRDEGLTRQELSDAQFLMAEAFRLYAGAGGLVETAASAPKSEQAELGRQADSLVSQALDLFARGYRTVASIKARAGIKAPLSRTAPPGSVPPGSAPPG